MQGAGKLEEKVARLADILCREGYMAEWRAEGDDFVLLLNHCPICTAATVCQRLCTSEIATFQKILGDGVTIEAHHRTYENLFNEQPGDLTAVCRPCHRVVTDHQRRIRFADREPRHADIRVDLENPSPLFDPTFKEMI